MENNGFTFELEDIINKMKKLRQKYKVEKDKAKRSGRGRSKGWKFFSKMDEVLAHKPNTHPPISIDSSSNKQITENENESNDENPDVGMLLFFFLHHIITRSKLSLHFPK